MPVQTTYSETLDAGRVGALVDTNEKVLVSRDAEETIGFGRPVVQGTQDRGIRLAAAGDATIYGISVRERSALDDEWKQYESVRVLVHEGTIWVETDTAVVAGDPVFVVLATATFANAGDVEMQARFEDSAAAGALVKIRLGL